MNINDVWHAILKRDASYDGKVVYACARPEFIAVPHARPANRGAQMCFCFPCPKWLSRRGSEPAVAANRISLNRLTPRWRWRVTCAAI